MTVEQIFAQCQMDIRVIKGIGEITIVKFNDRKKFQ